MDVPFRVGDVVQIRGQVRPMTVSAAADYVADERDAQETGTRITMIETRWFDERGELQRARFDNGAHMALDLVERQESGSRFAQYSAIMRHGD